MHQLCHLQNPLCHPQTRIRMPIPISRRGMSRSIHTHVQTIRPSTTE